MSYLTYIYIHIYIYINNISYSTHIAHMVNSYGVPWPLRPSARGVLPTFALLGRLELIRGWWLVGKKLDSAHKTGLRYIQYIYTYVNM